MRMEHSMIFLAFQSLRGFGVGWSADHHKALAPYPLVSIPERVWGGLELEYVRAALGLILVSIPERVWGGLEHAW